jgi:hypothetical protein
LPGAARVGVGILFGERNAGILSHRGRSVGEFQGIWVETGLEIEDEGPSGRERLVPFDPDV